MNYYDTWFGKNGIVMYGGGEYCNRQYWLHVKIDVFTGKLVPMHKKNEDGSISVLGAEIITFYCPVVLGSHYRDGMQRSIAMYAERIKELGAKIIKQTKNTLMAVHGEHRNECITIELKTTKNEK